MDQPGTDEERLLKELKKQLDDGCMEFGRVQTDDFYDQLAMCDEIMLEAFLETGQIETVQKMQGTCAISETNGETAVLVGNAPVMTMRNYQQEVVAYTKGLGRLFCSLKEYEPCHNAEEVIESSGYDLERDVENPPGSVFCAHGAGFLVEWDAVKDYMHVESYFQEKGSPGETTPNRTTYPEERSISLE